MRTVHRVLGTIAAAFGRGAEPKRPVPNRARLALEPLDPRLAPSSLFEIGFTDPTTVNTRSGSALNGVELVTLPGAAPAAPRLTNFKGIEVAGGLYRFEGDVIDANPGGLTVTLGGEPLTIRGVTVTTDANGHFSKTISLKTDGSDNGTADAETVNAAGVRSNIAFTLIQPG